jgi:hypothetical protein
MGRTNNILNTTTSKVEAKTNPIYAQWSTKLDQSEGGVLRFQAALLKVLDLYLHDLGVLFLL